jgi:hypothetical protein
MKETESERERRRWINLGEIIAIGALIVSAVGVWISWKSTDHQGPATVIEKRQSIPLTLRATAERDGRTLVILPVEASHALESLTLSLKGAQPIELGSDGRLDADSLNPALDREDNGSKGIHSIPVKIDARYVEAGTDKKATGNYRLRYRWEGGGLFGGRSLRLISLGRA